MNLTADNANDNLAELENVKRICSNFYLKGNVIGWSSIKSGNINKTYAVFTEDDNKIHRTYLLQRINANVFKNPEAISRNMEAITSYIYNRLPESSDKKRMVERLIKQKTAKHSLLMTKTVIGDLFLIYMIRYV